MTTWDGTGLPPAAQARVDRAGSSGVRSSLLSVPGHVGIESCGFTPVGEVMGCIVQYIGFQGYGGCGWYGAYGSGAWGAGYAAPPTVTSGAASSSAWAGFAPYVNALYHGWDTAIARMIAEARALGADGVVGVSLVEHHLGAGNREFVALGTAVRSVAATHVSRPFTTTLAGQDVAKLVHSGWMPAAIIVGISVAIRHDDFRTLAAQRAWSANVEIDGYTELVTAVRADARHQLARRTAHVGADGAILDSPVRLTVHELEVGEGHSDHVAESSVLASAVVRFHRAETLPPAPMMVLPLRGAGVTTRRKAAR
ncbi:MAG TPA: heavy metal-binding domain-containing protein [Acidimicrobiales bacterium]|nr:heavy metal-binding domain-containing protein [Acidimicrobiales bacterium]